MKMAPSSSAMRRRRPAWVALLVVLVSWDTSSSSPSSAAAAATLESCAAITIAANTLTSNCQGVCTSGSTATDTSTSSSARPSLCVYRNHSQSCAVLSSLNESASASSPSCVSAATCSVDCIASTPSTASTAWTLEWVESSIDGQSPVLFTSESISSSATTTTSITLVHETITHIDDQLALPESIQRFSIKGSYQQSPPHLQALQLSTAMLKSFSPLQELSLDRINLSDWTSLPEMPKLRTLSLTNVALTLWPVGAWFSNLEALSLDGNPLAAFSTKDPLIFASALRSLSLRSCGLTSVPAAIAGLNALRVLSLDDNALQTTEPPLGLPVKLSSLSLRGCGLTRVPVDVTSSTTLESLDLSHNPEIGKSTVAPLPATIQDLKLASCGLTAFPASPLKGLTLTKLDLSSNALDDKDTALSAQLALFPKLSTLDLSSTLRTSVPAAVATMTQLTDLSLASNAIHTIDGSTLPSTLQHLNVAYNSPLSLSPLSSTLGATLQSLNVSHCSLSSLAFVQPLVHTASSTLWTLDASGNALTDATELDLPSTLRVLNLSNNQLSTLPAAIFKLTDLQQLDLRGNPIAAGSISSLSSTQVTFLHKLRTFAVDAAVFASTNCNSSSSSSSTVVFSFNYSVCVDGDDNADPTLSSSHSGVDDTATVDEAALAKARVNRNLIIIAATIGSSLLLLLLSILWMRHSGRLGHNGDDHHLHHHPHFDLHGKAVPAHHGHHPHHPHHNPNSGRLGLGDEMWPTELTGDRDMTDHEWRALQMWTFWDDADVLQMRLPWDMVRDRQVIGSGRYSVLWLARVDGRAVFLKALQPTAHRQREEDGEGSVAAVQSLIREIQLLRTLRHPHVVELIGVTWMNAPTDVQVVLEDMANGDLRAYVEMTQSPPPPPGRWRGTAEGLAMRVALQIADALVFLHEKGVVHNDVRSRNVVLDDDCNAKLTGLGRHAFVEEGEEDRGGGKGGGGGKETTKRSALPPPTMDHAFLLDAGRWMAPERLREYLQQNSGGRRHGRAVTTKAASTVASTSADVYSFGVLLLELDTFDLPFSSVGVDDEDEEDDEERSSSDEDQVADHPPAAPPSTHPHVGVRAAAGGVGPHDAHALRFSSMPADHSSLLGQPTSLQLPVPEFLPSSTLTPDSSSSLASSSTSPHAVQAAGVAMVGPLSSTHSSEEERYEGALLKRLARAAVHIDLSPSCPIAVGELIRDCLDFRPEMRPSMRHVRDTLRTLATARTNSQRSSASTRSSARHMSLRSNSGGGGDGSGPHSGPMHSTLPTMAATTTSTTTTTATAPPPPPSPSPPPPPPPPMVVDGDERSVDATFFVRHQSPTARY